VAPPGRAAAAAGRSLDLEVRRRDVDSALPGTLTLDAVPVAWRLVAQLAVAASLWYATMPGELSGQTQ
jgi:hypothetical protein